MKAVMEKVVSSRKAATMVTARKTIFSSFKCSEKMVFPKKSHWNMIFLIVLSGQVIFLFPENMIFFFRRKKMKDDLSQKYTWKYDIFFKCPKKMVFPIKIALEYDLSCITWKDGIFFLKIWYFFFGSENERWSFSRNTWKYDIFCTSSPEKIHLKVINILDCILERVPAIICTFMETFIGVFIYCFPVKKTQET